MTVIPIRFMFGLMIIVAASIMSGCNRATALEEIPVGSQVTIETEDGRVVTGTLTDVTVDRVVVTEADAGERRELDREVIAAVHREGRGLTDLLPGTPAPVEVTIPAESTVSITLDTTVTSDGNAPGDSVRARTREPVAITGQVVVPAGSELQGTVTVAEASGKVEGRARLSLRFTEVTAYGETYTISTAPLVYQAEGTKADDAKTIGIGAAAGAIIGGLTGGKKGAAVGTAIGGGAGTAVVLTTPGEDIRLAAGTTLELRLLAPLTMRVPRAES